MGLMDVRDEQCGVSLALAAKRDGDFVVVITADAGADNTCNRTHRRANPFDDATGLFIDHAVITGFITDHDGLPTLGMAGAVGALHGLVHGNDAGFANANGVVLAVFTRDDQAGGCAGTGGQQGQCAEGGKDT
jgi:hypothetical protein